MPVVTPLVNMLPRRRGVGVDIVHWKAITSFDTARNWGTLAEGALPSQVSYAVAQMQNTVQTIGLMNQVSFQAQWRGRSLEADVRARRIAELLYQLKMTEERWVLGASSALMVPPAPVAGDGDQRRNVRGGDLLGEGDGEERAGRDDRLDGQQSDHHRRRPRLITMTLFTVPNATQYNVYIAQRRELPGRCGGVAPGGPLWRQRAQPAVGAVVTLADGVTMMPSGEVNPAS